MSHDTEIVDEHMKTNSVETDVGRGSLGNMILTSIFLIVNSSTRVLIGIIMFVCIWFASRAQSLSALQAHIILGVIGYIFLITQGTMILSKYNTWTTRFNCVQKRIGHSAVETLGIVISAAGSIIMMLHKTEHFTSAHGVFGLLALLMSLTSFFNGVCCFFLDPISSYINPQFTRCLAIS